jgi:mRNA-degrading endonuclease RelE of RelBE toxin-antitoxin system
MRKPFKSGRPAHCIWLALQRKKIFLEYQSTAIFFEKVAQMVNFLYLCAMKRTLYKSKAFEGFYSSLSKRTKKKVDYVVKIVQDEEVISTKFVKKIISSDFYELRIFTDNEYRVITFAIDNESLINSTKVLLLNGFTKKSEADYVKQIVIAENIINKEEFKND